MCFFLYVFASMVIDIPSTYIFIVLLQWNSIYMHFVLCVGFVCVCGPSRGFIIGGCKLNNWGYTGDCLDCKLRRKSEELLD